MAVGTVLLAGCGLVIDLEPSREDAATASDAGTLDADVATDTGLFDAEDAADDCVGVTETLPLDALSFEERPATVTTACNRITLDALGAPTDGTPAVAPAVTSPDRLVVYLRAGDLAAAALQLDFARPVRDLSFVFEWLSYNPSMQYDERLRVHVDGVLVTPMLAWEANIARYGDELGATAPKGDGQVVIDRVSSLTIELRNADTGDGVGIEIHTFMYTIDG